MNNHPEFKIYSYAAQIDRRFVLNSRLAEVSILSAKQLPVFDLK